jgi:CheY-like chemotaxis protein
LSSRVSRREKRMARVTVVDDSPEFLDLIDAILRGDQHDTTLIDPNEDGALQLIRRSSPDVLMIDVRIGADGVHGRAIAQKVRARSEFDGLPVLVCSADKQALSEIAATLAANRRVGMLAMPFEIDELTEAIDRLLDEGLGPQRGTEGQSELRQTQDEGGVRTASVNRTYLAISQIQPGWNVYSSDGQGIGYVAEVAVNYIVVEMALLLPKDLYVPASAIASVSSDRVELSIPKDAVEDQDWDSPPDEMITSDTYLDPGSASLGRDDGTRARRDEVPVDRPTASIEAESGTVAVPVSGERAVVGNVTPVVEELNAGKVARRDPQRVSDTVRREEFKTGEEGDVKCR